MLSFLPQFLPFASRNATETQDTHFYNIFLLQNVKQINICWELMKSLRVMATGYYLS
jgi:hypothetical protein